MFWGFSEALDLREEYQRAMKIEPSEINILLYGGGDPRHIIKTISKNYVNQTKINFFCVEGCVELIARNMLLIAIALENPDDFSIRAKTHLYMDVFGNSLLRPFSNSYVSSKAENFIKVVTDADYAQEHMPIFSFENFKYRERDHFENTFKFWTNKKENIFDIKRYWDQRIRKDLGPRYDHRSGAFDWDLQMTIKDNGVKQICPQEYAVFRDSGIAFTFPEYEHAYPNKTFAIGIVKNGNTYFHRGSVGDNTVGPYMAFGVHCDDGSMLTSDHGTNRFRSTDVTERNLYEIIYEIEQKVPYFHDKKNTHEYGSYYLAAGKNISHPLTNDDTALKTFDKPLVDIENITITYLSVDEVLKIHTRPEYKNKFDVIFVAANYFPFLKKEFSNLFSPESLIIFESKQYTTLKKDAVAEFLKKIRDFSKVLGLKAITNFSINLPFSVIKYKNTQLDVAASGDFEEIIN